MCVLHTHQSVSDLGSWLWHSSLFKLSVYSCLLINENHLPR